MFVSLRTTFLFLIWRDWLSGFNFRAVVVDVDVAAVVVAAVVVVDVDVVFSLFRSRNNSTATILFSVLFRPELWFETDTTGSDRRQRRRRRRHRRRATIPLFIFYFFKTVRSPPVCRGPEEPGLMVAWLNLSWTEPAKHQMVFRLFLSGKTDSSHPNHRDFLESAHAFWCTVFFVTT